MTPGNLLISAPFKIDRRLAIAKKTLTLLTILIPELSLVLPVDE